MGTPEYMSPEQARGREGRLRSDLYSLGVMIWELFSGEVPFSADTPLATFFKHVQEPPPFEAEAGRRLPASLVPVLQRALAKEPGSVTLRAEMIEALRARAPPPASAGT